MIIAIDAMGGDYAPEEIVGGALAAARELDCSIILVGDREQVIPYVSDLPDNVSIVHCSQVIDMGEKPAAAIRKKPDASICVATKLVRDGKASAVVSAGSTGAQMAAALFFLGRVPEVHRPAIAATLPGIAGPKLLIDVGANVDCRPENLVEFAVMGSSYVETVMGIKEPLVGLLNIGQEESKGNSLTTETFNLLKKSGVNFFGNIEARDVFTGDADIIVCDGFVGNALLKFGEGLVDLLNGFLRDYIGKSGITKLGGLCLRSAFKDLKKKMDWEEFGGAPLLGVKKISIVCHGSSKGNAVKSAVKVAYKCVNNNFIQHMSHSIKEEKVAQCTQERL
jgi:glycerol-3-phosphate acyltransferase PlsX